ncbi:RodZ family helix-turn-helix domain-containing protein [Bordetella sp. 15P40C-2]|uniref:helix-turn-helix domain-containing protein n=1 Tax=Bordetella sp. 15P40C-2 TaxID=2572246 RepID=UPI00132C3927|nr:helix-turn-helix domain-containing protein [Bordetella sp. 15P40C-2]MVW72221.1 helix-turn-helix domain-containing protein [Bordetella sp. 15P40C-2]
MTEGLNSAAIPARPTTSPAAAKTDGVVSVGESLKTLRAARGLSLEDVSERIKFAPRQIEALEAEQWDKLPKGMSLRGLVRSYARLLETDPAALIASVESHVGALSAPGSVHRESRTVPVAVNGSGEDRGGSSWGWTFIILALLAGLFAYAIWQHWIPADWLPSWLAGAQS